MAIVDSTGKMYQESENTPDMSELASAGYNLYGKGKIVPYNPDSLIGRKGFDIYDQMRIDDQVKACLTLKKFATLAPSYQIIPASNDEQDEEIADFVQYCFEKMEGNITDALLEILTALDYGFSITEINYKSFDTGLNQGKIGLRNLKTKQPHYYRFEVDKFGNLVKDGIIYSQNVNEASYPIQKFLIFSYQKEFGNWYGTSDLRPAYRGYWSKDVLIKMWNIYLERFANPTVVGKYKSNDPTSRTNLRDILDNLTAKTSITHRLDEFDIQFLESHRNATGDFKDALDFYNKAIARSILIPDRLMAAGDTGAYSQAKIHFDVFLWVIQKLRQDIADTVMNEQLIKRLVAYNYSNVTELPKFTFNPMTDEQKQALNTMFITAVEKGVIVPTLEDENILREHLSFPAKDLDLTPEQPSEEVTETPDEEILDDVANNNSEKVATHEYVKSEAEKRVDFRKIDKELDKLDKKLVDNAREVLQKQMEAVQKYITNKMEQNKFDFTAIEKLDLKFKGQLQEVFRNSALEAYEAGKVEMQKEIPKKFVKGVIGSGIAVTGFEAFLKAKAKIEVSVITNIVTEELETLLVYMLRTGATIPETMLAIEGVFSKFNSNETTINPTTDRLNKPYRLEAIARTTSLGAYNYGRRYQAEQPELKDVVIGYHLSPILDQRTTDICQFVAANNINIRINDGTHIAQLMPPLHWNCRTLLTTILVLDEPVTFSDNATLGALAGMRKST
jgi:phage gp29-like protein